MNQRYAQRKEGDVALGRLLPLYQPTPSPRAVESSQESSTLDESEPGSTRAALPGHLRDLLTSAAGPLRDAAWQRFLASHHELLLRTVRSVAPDHDAAMDLYTRALEQLRREDFRRLKAYDPAVGRFETWLVVVIRRLFLDLARELYGRQRVGANPAPEWRRAERDARRRLVDLVADEMETVQVRASTADPELELRRNELSTALARAVDALPAEDRLLLKLRFERQLSARDILRLMDFPTVFHVYRRVNHLLGGLKVALQRAGISDAEP